MDDGIRFSRVEKIESSRDIESDSDDLVPPYTMYLFLCVCFLKNTFFLNIW